MDWIQFTRPVPYSTVLLAPGSAPLLYGRWWWWLEVGWELVKLFMLSLLEKVTLLGSVKCSLCLLWLQMPSLLAAVRLWKLSLPAWVPWPKLY